VDAKSRFHDGDLLAPAASRLPGLRALALAADAAAQAAGGHARTGDRGKESGVVHPGIRAGQPMPTAHTGDRGRGPPPAVQRRQRAIAMLVCSTVRSPIG
jgi:hypothetical protein